MQALNTIITAHLMKLLLRISIYVYLLCLLSSCVVSRKVNYFQEGDHVPEYESKVDFEDYKLQKGDYLYIKVNTLNPEDAEMFNGSGRMYIDASRISSDNPVMRLYMYVVGEDGMINYPYVDKVKAEGVTLREVKRVLEEQLRAVVGEFSLDVRLANRTFSVIGESGSGRFPIPREKMTIYEALSMSGDLSMYADRESVQIIRDTPEGTVVKILDIRSRSVVNSEFYYIQPNDVIYIPFTNDRYWGVSHFTGVLSTVFSTVSFGLLIYNIVDRIVKSAGSAN